MVVRGATVHRSLLLLRHDQHIERAVIGGPAAAVSSIDPEAAELGLGSLGTDSATSPYLSKRLLERADEPHASERLDNSRQDRAGDPGDREMFWTKPHG